MFTSKWSNQRPNIPLFFQCHISLFFYSGKGQHLSQWYEADILINDGGENNFKMEVKTPSQKTFALAVATSIEQESPNTSLTFTIDYKSLENKNYKLKSTTNWKRLGIPYTFITNSQVKFTSPEGKETTVNTEAKHQIVSGTWEICYKVYLSVELYRVITPNDDRD